MNQKNNIIKEKKGNIFLIIIITIIILIILYLIPYLSIFNKDKKTVIKERYTESYRHEIGSGNPIKIEVTDENILSKLFKYAKDYIKYDTSFSKEDKELKFYKKEEDKIYFIGSYKCVNKNCSTNNKINTENTDIFLIQDGDRYDNSMFMFLYNSINDKISGKFTNTNNNSKPKETTQNYELGNGKPIKIEVTDKNIIKELIDVTNIKYINYANIEKNNEVKFYTAENNKIYFIGSYKCVSKSCYVHHLGTGVFEINDIKDFLYNSVNNKISEKFKASIIVNLELKQPWTRYIVRSCSYNGKERDLLLNENFKIIGMADKMGVNTPAQFHIGNYTNNYISIIENNKSGVMSLKDGSYIIPPKFESVFRDDTIYNLDMEKHIVESNGKMFEIDKKGNIISDSYEYLDSLGNGYYIAIIDKKGYVLDNKYKKVTEPIKLYTDYICGHNCCCGDENPIRGYAIIDYYKNLSTNTIIIIGKDYYLFSPNNNIKKLPVIE